MIFRCSVGHFCLNGPPRFAVIFHPANHISYTRQNWTDAIPVVLVRQYERVTGSGSISRRDYRLRSRL